MRDGLPHVTTLTTNGHFSSVDVISPNRYASNKIVSEHIRKEEVIENPFSYWKILGTSQLLICSVDIIKDTEYLNKTTQ